MDSAIAENTAPIIFVVVAVIGIAFGTRFLCFHRRRRNPCRRAPEHDLIFFHYKWHIRTHPAAADDGRTASAAALNAFALCPALSFSGSRSAHFAPFFKLCPQNRKPHTILRRLL